ncbi:hypothetical protein [Nitrosopumilus piranensis]|uniref:Uncharacterized protein n=1 Tax=Nitrosopumilus piranensis TaxID=1582439 RepID=A0A0C5BYF7_9ARCH|nr:hypothetical protein [Nitrosopumilus piranensis]AJM91995.1 exported protein of unknown function [Nitrosopumilus piranensis]
MKTRFFVIIGIGGLLILIPAAFAVESFSGTSSFENVPSEVSRHFPTTFDIKLQYTVGPWGFGELAPVIEITPASAASYISLDFEPIPLYRNSVGRIPVTVTVDPVTEHEKIFLTVSFEGHTSQGISFRSGWTDSLILSLGPRDEISRQVDYEKISWGELDVKNDASIFTKNMVSRSLVQAGEQFFVVQKVDFRDDNFAANSTFSAVVGYAFDKGDKMIPFPKGENVTDAQHQEFAEDQRKLNNEFYQNSKFAKSFEFKVTTEKPFLVKSPFVLQDPGKYTHQFYKKLKNSTTVLESNMGGTTVVEKFSKVLSGTECKNENHRMLIKHDYSTVVCVTGDTARTLMERGWSLGK